MKRLKTQSKPKYQQKSKKQSNQFLKIPIDQPNFYQTCKQFLHYISFYTHFYRMEWICLIDLEERYQAKEIAILRKWKRFTLYEHNSAVHFDENLQTFSCVFNSKKINSQHSIIGKIHGCLKTNIIIISETLTDHQVMLGAKWQYQKIQLTRFAFRYNQRSQNNILIKVNPVNGQLAVCMSFVITPGLFQEEHHFKQVMTDMCQSLGQESQKIFNTMMEIIYQRQANQPYMKSGVKVNPNFPRYMRVEKLLDKVKSLIATSSFYKIRVDTSSAHSNRSHFKKIFLPNTKKLIKQAEIQRMALMYEPKYNKVYEELPRLKMREKPKEFIKDYTELEEKNQVEFAKHLNQNHVYDEPAFIQLSIKEVKSPIMSSGESSNMKKVIKTSTQQQLGVLIDKIQPLQQKHAIAVLSKLKYSHPNIAKYYIDKKQPQARITEGFNSMTLQEFLTKNKKTISLSTKFDVMFQLCHALQYMHKNFVGCFIRPNDVIVDQNFKVKVRNLSYGYCINGQWKGNKKNSGQFSESDQIIKLQVDYQQSKIQFPYINIGSGLQSDMRMDPKRGVQNEKCDVFSLGMVLYRILMDKYPFNIESILNELPKMSIQEEYNKMWKKIWTVQTEYYLSQGGQIVKLVAHLLLRCFNTSEITSRPYVEWLTVILSEIKTSLNGLY